MSGSDLAVIESTGYTFSARCLSSGLLLCCLPLTSIRASIYMALALHLSLTDDSLLLPVASRGVAFDCETCRRALEDGDVAGAYQTFLAGAYTRSLLSST